MPTRRKIMPKGFKVKREGRVSADDRLYSSLNSKWIDPSAWMIGKNIGMFITVATPQIRI